MKKYNGATSIMAIVLAVSMTSPLGVFAKTSADKEEADRIPPGHFIAPGFQTKLGTSAPKASAEVKAGLPLGIQRILDRLASLGKRDNDQDRDKDDEKKEDTDKRNRKSVIYPKISDFRFANRADTSVIVTWKTNEPTDSKVYLSTESGVNASSSVAVASSSELTLLHSHVLASLSADTRYFIVVKSTDKDGNSSLLRERSFVTRPASRPDVLPPRLSNVRVSNVTSSSAILTWETNEQSSSKVLYGTSSPLTSNPSIAENTALVSRHSVVLNGLSPATLYYVSVSSTDAVGNSSSSGEFSLTTASIAPPDSRTPVLRFVTAWNIGLSGAHIAWFTDEPANSKVYLSTSTPLSLSPSNEVASSSSMVFFHDFSVTGLVASTTYYYAISSADATGNVVTSSEGNFTTRAQ